MDAKDKKRVLVIEDDPSIRQLLCEWLSLDGFEVSSASNGKEGIELLKSEQKPSVILLDLMMPIMDGYEFLERKKADFHFAKIPVIILSAYPEMKSRIESCEFIKKPLDLELLTKAVRAYCL